MNLQLSITTESGDVILKAIPITAEQFYPIMTIVVTGKVPKPLEPLGSACEIKKEKPNVLGTSDITKPMSEEDWKTLWSMGKWPNADDSLKKLPPERLTSEQIAQIQLMAHANQPES